MSDRIFLLEPEFQKCVTQCEFWTKGDLTIERAQLWRFGKVKVSAISEVEIEKAIKERDFQERVCISDKLEFFDHTLQDCVSDDLYFPDEMPEKEAKRLSELFSKDPEGMFEKEGWEIKDTKLYFEANIKISAIK
jgi:hypothetical protein